MRSRPQDHSRPVYSTERGNLCPECGRAVGDCSCRKAAAPPSDGVVRIGRITKGRKGKGVTTVTGVPLVSAELEKLAKVLKARCGAGGSLRDGTIEIQGDHRDLLLTELSAKGWVVKKAGG
jgi:translation initiation factor 1